MKKIMVTCAVFAYTFAYGAELGINSLRYRPLANTSILTTNGANSQFAMFAVKSRIFGLEPFIVKRVKFVLDTSKATPTDVRFLGWEAELRLQFSELMGSAPIEINSTNSHLGSVTFEVETLITLPDTDNGVALTLTSDHIQGFHTGDKICTKLSEITLTGTLSLRTVTLRPNALVEQPVQGREAWIRWVKVKNGEVTLEVHGEPHGLYRIESSGDFRSWRPATSFQGVPTGIRVFSVTPTPGVTSEFYRAVTF